jgi:hypothetical protein
VRTPGAPARAIAILAGAGVAAFAISTAAVSSATTQGPAVAAVKYPFASFSFTGGVSTATPASPRSFSLTFTTSFTLNPNSPGIVNQATGTLDTVTIKDDVKYPIPGGSPVGPAQLPFASENLLLTVAVAGNCWAPQPNGTYAFSGTLSCATSTLTLAGKAYKASSLLTSLTGTFTPPSPAAGTPWTGSLSAAFKNPGYTFPIAALGSGGGTTLQIGNNGATVPAQGVTFTGSTAAG